jgi:DNA-binding beta-propeller fold protein YncE
MKLLGRFDLSDSPFEGDQTLILRGLPVNARVLKAVVGLVPARDPTGELFEEIVSFSNSQGSFGTTKIAGTGSAESGRFVEVDFHKRRTLARVAGAGTVGANLQVDLGGGVYVEINNKGAIRAPGDTLFSAPRDGKLPGLVVTKFKLTGSDVDVLRVFIRSVPTNVSVRLGNLGPFWTHLGEFTTDDVSPDFASVLQAFLLEVSAENGFYSIPLVLHSDTIARLRISVDVEYQVEASVMPEGLNEVKLPFDFGSLPKARENVLQVDVPANMRVAPRGVTAHIRGAFDESRIAYGPTGAVTPEGAVEISPVSTQAQMILLPETTKAGAFDLLMVVEQTATFQLDLREDLDGKPGRISFLPGSVKFKLSAPVNVPLGGIAPTVQWVSVPLTAEFEFHANQRYWLVLQSVEGQAAWSVAAASSELGGMQHTRDGGLSWRDTPAPGISSSVSAFFRLRQKPERFEMPIELQVGIGDEAIRVSLDRFQPLGRVDFALDFDEVADAFNQYLDSVAPPTCPEIEHLANGNFEQWRSVGEKLGGAVKVNLPSISSIPKVMAISPDGRWAYIAHENGVSQIQVVDISCNRVLDESFSISGIGNPVALVFHPVGDRVYLLGSAGLLVVDTNARNTLGDPLEGLTASALAISPDGGLLYVTERANTGSVGGFIRVIDTLRLEQTVLTGSPELEIVTIGKSANLGNNPTGLAISPDGRRLYVALSKDENNGSVQVFDTATFHGAPPPQPIGSPEVGPEPRAIALTPDGKWVVVIAKEGEKAVSIIDTKTLTTHFVRLNSGSSPVAIAITPNGKKAYVAHGEKEVISIIDLARRSALPLSIRSVASQTAMALTPQGDRIYILGKEGTANQSTSLYFIETGVRVPAEWNLTAGQATPFCLPDPFHLIAVLGMPSSAEEGAMPQPIPSALSQTVPVVGSCPYEFSFYGIASDIGALAEVLWIGKDCRLLRTDQVQIQAREPREPEIRVPVQMSRGPEKMVALRPQTQLPPLHRAHLDAPTEAEQAEVRFSTPAGVAAGIDMVSLKATSETVINGDFKEVQQDSQVAGWNVVSSSGVGVALIATEDGVQLGNTGSETVELWQANSAKGGQLFELEFQGRVIRTRNGDSPRLEVQWFKEGGATAGPSTVLEILPAGSDSVLARKTSPAEAAEAMLRLIVPGGATLQIRRASLRFSSITSVPVTFIAQVPGELTVSSWKVAFEQKKAEVPGVPEKGLCPSTPLGREPGGAHGNCCYCPCCGAERTMVDSKQITTMAGQPALAGQCADCGAELIRGGGFGDMIQVPELRLKVQPLIVNPIRHAKAVVTQTARVEIPLTAIHGIGDARARKLKEHGIDTISKLAAADPEELVKLLRGAAPELAQRIVTEARQLSLKTEIRAH